MAVAARPTQPRVPPLAADARSPEAEQLLARLPAGPDGGALNVSATMAHHPGLLKGWLAFGTALFTNGKLPPATASCWPCGPSPTAAAPTSGASTSGSPGRWGSPTTRSTGCCSGRMRPVGIPMTPLSSAAPTSFIAGSCVSEATWATLASRYDHALMVEALFTVGQYHLGSFLLNSAGVSQEPGM